MSKETTCKYNENRDYADVVMPFCRWPVDCLPAVWPPHITVRYVRDRVECSNCKAYVKVEPK